MSDRQAGGSFIQRHPRITVGLVIAVLLVLVELASGLVIYGAHTFAGTPKRISVFAFHPLITGENILGYEGNWALPHPVRAFANRIHVSGECGYTTDRHGFIHNGDETRTIAREDFTVFLLGGSTAAGHGASCNEQTISAHLERILAERYEGTRVINAGVPGYFSAQELMRLANEIVFFDPDIVISFSGTNDLNRQSRDFQGREHNYHLHEHHVALLDSLEETDSLLWSVGNLLRNLVGFTEYTYTRFLLEKGTLYLMGRIASPSQSDVLENTRRLVGFDEIEPGDLPIPDEDFEAAIAENVHYYSTFIREARAVAESAGAQHFLFLQPMLLSERRVLTEAEAKSRDLMKVGWFRKAGFDLEGRTLLFRELAGRALAEAGVEVHDLRDVFPDGSSVYSDYLHYTDEGNRLIAAEMARVLIESGAIPQALTR